MPYFYVENAPQVRKIYRNTLILPHQTHLGAENALFLRKKRGPGDVRERFCADAKAFLRPRGRPGAVLCEGQSVFEPQRTSESLFCRTKRTSEPKVPYFYIKKGPGTEESIQIPLFCRTKRTSEPKMPYFYLQKPFFNEKSIEIAYFYLKNAHRSRK